MICSNFLLWKPNSNLFIRITEGSGCNLTAKDIDDGFVDYVDYDIYEYDGSEFSIYDGGIYLLRQPYQSYVDESELVEYLKKQDCIPNESYQTIYKEQETLDYFSQKEEEMER